MELKEFVSDVLTQIMQGVIDAQEKTKGTNGVVCPKKFTNFNTEYKGHNGEYLGLVNFEIGLSNDNTKRSGAGIGVMFGSLGVDAKVGSDKKTAAITSVSFNVPIQLPSTE